MRYPVLLSYAAPQPLIDALERDYHLLGPLTEMTPAALPAGSAQARAMVTKGGLPIDAALLDQLPALELIQCYGTGYDLIDLKAAAARGIRIANAGDANAPAVAEFATMLMLSGVRNLAGYDQLVRSGQWNDAARGAMPLSPGLAGRRIGIYGLGAIGSRVAQQAEALAMAVGYTGRRQHPDVRYHWCDTLDELAEWADVLMVTVRAGDNNRHAVNRGVLKALGPNGYLVNISRGYVVEEAALIAALANDDIAGAGLDVFEHEPWVPEELRNDARVLMTPHVAPHSEFAQRRMRERTLDNLRALFEGQPLTCEVTG
ncbi:NAD(P)-dependent oxidoreductase [Carnimonas bestiolae]|uniref:NAD(P)-dependent oxidoreductase n=1 Tax=Carnimonas bestiolae TaxID=3402172 RepID=UPI003EDC780A